MSKRVCDAVQFEAAVQYPAVALGRVSASQGDLGSSCRTFTATTGLLGEQSDCCSWLSAYCRDLLHVCVLVGKNGSCETRYLVSLDSLG